MYNESFLKITTHERNFLQEKETRRTIFFAGLLIFICTATMLVHWPLFSAQALSFDDSQYLTDNILVRNPSWTSARRFFTEIKEPSTVKGYYQPLTMLSLMLDYESRGPSDDLTVFHRTNLILHVLNTVLIIVLLYLLFGNALAAAGTGLLFAFHPMTVEPIACISERKTLLAMFFSVLSLIFFIRFTQKKGWKSYIICIIMYILALLSKPTSTLLPIAMLIIDFWPLRRLNYYSLIEKIPHIIVGCIAAIITYISQSLTASVTSLSEQGIDRISLIFCHSIFFYLYKIIWPINLSPYYGFPQPLALSNPVVFTSTTGTCIIICFFLISLNWTRSLLTGWLFFLTVILPTLGFIGFSDVIAADKHVYLPSIGLLIVIAYFFCWIIRISQENKSLLLRVCIVLIVLIITSAEAVTTRLYLSKWSDTVSLHKHMLTIRPSAAAVHNNLGNALMSQGNIGDAINHYSQALKFESGLAQAHNNLGIALQLSGNTEDGIFHYREAIRLKPNFVEAYNNLAWAIATHPNLQIHYDYINQALMFAKRACILTKNQDAATLDTLATVYAAFGWFGKAAETAQEALVLALNIDDRELANQICEHLELYKQQKPYLEDPSRHDTEITESNILNN